MMRNQNKKLILFLILAVFAGYFPITNQVKAADGVNGESINIGSFNPSPADTSVTVSGTAGGGYASQGIDCAFGRGGPTTDTEATRAGTAGTYTVDGGPPSGSFTLTT